MLCVVRTELILQNSTGRMRDAESLATVILATDNVFLYSDSNIGRSEAYSPLDIYIPSILTDRIWAVCVCAISYYVSQAPASVSAVSSCNAHDNPTEIITNYTRDQRQPYIAIWFPHHAPSWHPSSNV